MVDVSKGLAPGGVSLGLLMSARGGYELELGSVPASDLRGRLRRAGGRVVMARLSHLSYMFGHYGPLTPADTSQFCEMVADALAEARRLLG